MPPTYREPNRCTHCGKLTDDPTDDHVLPSSYYPDTISRAERGELTVPSCKPCNGELGRVEEFFRERHAGAAAPSQYNTGVFERVLKSANEGRGRNEGDKRARRAKRQEILDSVVVISPDEARKLGTPPGPPRLIRGPEGILQRGYIGMKAPFEASERIAEKFVRGLYRYHLDVLVPRDRLITVTAPRDRAAVDRFLVEQHDALEKRVVGGGAFCYASALAVPDPGQPADLFNSHWFFLLWNQVLLMATCGNPQLHDRIQRLLRIVREPSPPNAHTAEGPGEAASGRIRRARMKRIGNDRRPG